MIRRLWRLGQGVTLALLAATALVAEDFHAVTPTLRIMAQSDTYRATAPALRIVARPDTYRTTTPPLRITAQQDTYRTTAPTLRVVARQNTYRATTPPLRIVAEPSRYRATTPTLRIISLPETSPLPEPEQQTAATDVPPHCVGLLECAPQQNVKRIEADLRSLGYAPETDPMFCRNVAQSLDTCTAFTSTPSDPDSDALLQSLWQHTGDDAAGPSLNRCPPLETYAIDLQRRSDAGEDTSVEEANLVLLVSAASVHLINGRPEIWCNQIAAGLP